MKTRTGQSAKRVGNMQKIKKETAIFTAVIAVLAVLTIVFTCLGISKIKNFVFPSDLGVKYDKNDLDSFDEKLDIDFTVPNTPSGDAQTPEDIMKGEIGVDYTIKYSDFKEKTLSLTASEATAMLNERMPSLYFFKDSQIKPDENGNIAFFSKCDIRQAVEKLFPEEEFTIPEATPVKIPFGATVNASVNSNILAGKVVSLDPGVISLLPISEGQEFTADLSEFFIETPEMYISDMHVTSDGMISISGMLPSKAELIPLT